MRILSIVLFCFVASAAFKAHGQTPDPDVACQTAKSPGEVIEKCRKLIGPDFATEKRAGALLRIAIAQTTLGEFEDAVFELDRVLALEPSNDRAMAKRGWAKFKMSEPKGPYDEALKDLSTAINMRPTAAEAFQTRGYVHLRAGDTQAAVRDYTQAIKLRPDFARAYSDRGWANAKLKNFDAAIADYTKAIELDPKFAAAYVTRCWLRITRDNDSVRAIEDCSKAIALNPNLKWAYDNRGWAHSRLGKYDEAIRDFTEAIRIDPKLAVAYNARGAVYWRQGLRRKAIDEFTLALTFNPRLALALANRALVRESRGQIQRAIADYEAVLDIPPKGTEGQWAQRTARERLALLLKRRAETGGAQPESALRPTRKVALVIGNGNYSSLWSLVNPVNDARSVAATLRALGFSKVMTRFDLSLGDFRAALVEFAGLVEQSDWAVVYFAGHGVGIQGQNYMIPIEAKLSDQSKFQDEAIPLNDLIHSVLGARSLRLVILDACRENPFVATPSTTSTAAGTAPDASGLLGKGFSVVEPQGGVVVQFSARHGTRAQDGRPGTNSPYTAELVRLMREPGLEVGLLFRRVRERVMSLTERMQEPASYGLPPGTRIYFRPPG